MNNEQDNVKVLATKVSVPVWRRFKRVLVKKGITAYYAIQNFIDVFIRFGDDRHNLTPEMEALMSLFEHADGWQSNFNLADPDANPEIAEATYYLRDKEKKGVRVVHVELPFFGQWTQTWNVQQILEKFLCLTFPQLYMRLRALAVLKECNSILELLISVLIIASLVRSTLSSMPSLIVMQSMTQRLLMPSGLLISRGTESI